MGMKAFLKNFARAIGGSERSRSSELDVLVENVPFEAKMKEQYPCKVLGYSSFYNDQGNGVEQQNWGPNSVIGPCTCYPTLGDSVTSWCPASTNGREHIIVEYEYPVLAKEVHVYETLGPGSTCKISGKVYKGEDSSEKEEWVVLWEDQSVTTNTGANAARDFSPPLSQLILTKTIRVNLKISSTWSEIDTIKLVGHHEVDHLDISELGSEYKQLFTKSQLNEETYSDVTISLVNTNDKQLYLHKGLIASRSPYLLKQLTVQDGSEVKLGLDVSFANFREAISFLYSNHCEVSRDNIFELYSLSKIFECEDLSEFCELNLTLILTPSNLKELYEESVQQHNQLFVNAILRTMAKHYERIQHLMSVLSENDLSTLKDLIKKAKK